MALPVFTDLQLDYVHFYVGDVATGPAQVLGGHGFVGSVVPSPVPIGPGARTVELAANEIRLLFSQPLDTAHPGTEYVARHGDGVSDIALRVRDARAAYDTALRRGARPAAAPIRVGNTVTASVVAFGDVTHTFVEYLDRSPKPVAVTGEGPKFFVVDHFAVCVDYGHVDETVAFYTDVLDFDLIFTETLQIGAQAITTKVVQSKSGSVTLTLIEPDTTREAGHIEDFLSAHDGPGVQHIAFATDDIVTAVDSLRERGIVFMQTPDSYYGRVLRRVVPARYTVEQLRQHQVLVDSDHDGQLFQIFTSSVHPRNTIFMELIERWGARSFGSGNITALYEAAERERHSTAQAA